MNRIRVTGLLLKSDKLLVLKESVNGRNYSLPGGGVEDGESLDQALKREFVEELAMNINVRRIAYVSEYVRLDGVNVLELAFIVESADSESKEIEKAAYLTKIDLKREFPNTKLVEILSDLSNNYGTYLGKREP